MVEDTPDELIYDLFSSHFYPRQRAGPADPGHASAPWRRLSRRQLLRLLRERLPAPEHADRRRRATCATRDLSRLVRATRSASWRAGPRQPRRPPAAALRSAAS